MTVVGEKGRGSLKESKEVTGRAAQRLGVARDCDSRVGGLFQEGTFERKPEQ